VAEQDWRRAIGWLRAPTMAPGRLPRNGETVVLWLAGRWRRGLGLAGGGWLLICSWPAGGRVL